MIYNLLVFYLPDTENNKIKNGGGIAVKYFYSSSFDLNTTFSFAEFNNVNNYGINKDKIIFCWCNFI